jgi:hypothetical protein
LEETAIGESAQTKGAPIQLVHESNLANSHDVSEQETPPPTLPTPVCGQVANPAEMQRRTQLDIQIETETVTLGDLAQLSPTEPIDISQRQTEMDMIIQAIQTLDEDFTLAGIRLVHDTRTVDAWRKGDPPSAMTKLRKMIPGWVTLLEHRGVQFSRAELQEAIKRFAEADYFKRFKVNGLGARIDGTGFDAALASDLSDTDVALFQQTITQCLLLASGITALNPNEITIAITRGGEISLLVATGPPLPTSPPNHP